MIRRDCGFAIAATVFLCGIIGAFAAFEAGCPPSPAAPTNDASDAQPVATVDSAPAPPIAIIDAAPPSSQAVQVCATFARLGCPGADASDCARAVQVDHDQKISGWGQNWPCIIAASSKTAVQKCGIICP